MVYSFFAPSCVMPPPIPPHRGHGPPQEVLGPLHQETVWQRPDKRSDGRETDQPENHMNRPGNPCLLQALEKSYLETFTIKRHIQGET